MRSRCDQSDEEVKTGKLQSDPPEMNVCLSEGATEKAGAWLLI